MSDIVDSLRGCIEFDGRPDNSILAEAADEIDRLRAAKTAALKIADERAKEAVELRAKLATANDEIDRLRAIAIERMEWFKQAANNVERLDVQLASARKALDLANEYFEDAVLSSPYSRRVIKEIQTAYAALTSASGKSDAAG
jgi:DNA repair exonuclease SbcCD ATPase subunit